MANRLRVSTGVALVLYTLMPAVAGLAQERATGTDVPDAALKAVKPDEPPPLRFDQKPVTPPPAGGRWTSYASELNSRFKALFDGDSQLAGRDLDMTIELWIGPEGRIARAQLVGSSGDPAVDTRLRNKVLAQFTLPPPSKDMPMPVKVRVAGKRSGSHDR